MNGLGNPAAGEDALRQQRRPWPVHVAAFFREQSRGGAVANHRRHRVQGRRSSRLSAALWACTAYGLTATSTLVAIALIGDRTTLTYLAALIFFWWLFPAPVLLLWTIAVRSPAAVLATLVAPALLSVHVQGPFVLNALGGGPDDRPADLRVATFNLTNGRPMDSLATLVAEHRPDVLLLQEVNSSREQLAELVPDYPYASMGPGINGPGNDGYAVLSRHPVTGVQPVTGLPPNARPADLVTVTVDGRPLTLLSVHLASPCIGCPSDARVPGGDTAEAARLRLAETRRYIEVLADVLADGTAVVVGGDLNSSPLNRPLHEFTALGLTDAWGQVGTSPGLTRGPGPGVARVDVVLVAGMDAQRVVKGSRGHSTHSPVIADLVWS